MFLGTRGVAGTAAGRRFTSVPALVRRRSDTHFASAPILSKTTRDINAFVLESAFVFFWLRAFRDTKTRGMATMHTMPTSAPRITSRWGCGPYRDDEFFVLADNKTNDGYHGPHEYQVITNKRDSLVSIRWPWLPRPFERIRNC